MTQYLPPNLLAFFAPREPLPFLPPLTKLPHEKKSRGYTGVGQYLSLFEDPKDTPPPIKIETREERLERKKREKLEKAAYIKEQGIALWDPHNNPTSTSDPYKTLFVARVSLDTSESKLKKEFEAFGPVRKVSLITDKITGKPKGYAFVEFENEKDMHAAYKHADGKKIDGRRVLVDVERGRTVKGWLPRRLGGGLSDSKPRVQVREEREEKSFGSRDRFDSRRGAAGDRGDRGRDRSDRRRRSKSRERERDRGSRDRTRDRDRHKDRYERKAKHRHSRRSRDRHVAHSSSTSPYDGAAIGGGAYEDDYERKPSIRGLSDSDSGSTRKHRSRSKDRSEKKRSYARSRSRSPSQDRKRSRYDKNGDGGIAKHGRHQPYSDSGEMEEGEDRSYDSEYTRRFHSSSNNNGQVTIKNEDDYEDSFTSQPGYGGYKD